MAQPNPVFKNRILKALPRQELDALVPHLEAVELEQHKVLYDVGQKFEYVYFVEQGVASIISTMETGISVEVGMVGFEGVTPIAALFGDEVSQQQNVIQLPGHGYRISVPHCRAAFENGPVMRKAILHFVSSLLNLSAQTAACNRLHSVEQRLARWLLMSQDRYESEILPLTQEYLAAMLGVRRAGITENAGDLQRSGLINYNRGQITIIDRAGVERTACECYAADYERFNSLI